jgi:hypothetical protein
MILKPGTKKQLFVDRKMLPMIPDGVLKGYHCTKYIYFTLFFTSLILLCRAIWG